MNDSTTHIQNLCREAIQLRDALLSRGADYAVSFGSSASDYGLWLAQENSETTSYQLVPPRCKKLLEHVEAAHSVKAKEEFLQLVATHEILRLPDRLSMSKVPASVLPWLERCVRRMLADLATPRSGYFNHDNDTFVKDLAVCRLKLLPCGIEMVDSDMAFGRSAIWKFGLSTAWQLGMATLQMGGNRPLFCSHIDRRAIREFSPQGYLRFYHIVADILRLQPHVRGLMAQAWLLDAALGRISPELAYVHDIPASGGAVFFPAPDDSGAIADAIRMSPHRRKLYDAGQYKPCSYVMVWPRKALLRWADNNPLVSE